MIELTNLCNYKCIHCYNDTKNISTIPFNNFKSIITQLKSIGALNITLTGGEISTISNVESYIKYAKNSGFFVNVITNASNIKFNEFLIHSKIDRIKISLYSLDEDINNVITQNYSSYNKSIKFIQDCMHNNINIDINTVALKTNFKSLQYLHKWAKENPNLNVFIDHKIFPVRNESTPNNNYLILNNEELDYLVKKDVLKTNKIKPLCTAGLNKIRIDSSMNIFPCEHLNIKLGNIKDMSIQEILNSHLMYEFKENIKNYFPNKCSNCNKNNICVKCPAFTWNKNKYNNEIDDLMCKYTIFKGANNV